MRCEPRVRASGAGRRGVGGVARTAHLDELLELLVDEVLEAVDADGRLLLHQPHELGDHHRVLLLELILQRLRKRVGVEGRHVDDRRRDHLRQ